MDRESGTGQRERTAADVFSIVPDPVLVFDTDEREIVDANEAAVNFLDYDRESLLGMELDGLAPAHSSDSRTAVQKGIDAGIETGESRFECQLRRADGEQRQVDISVKLATLSGVQRVLAFVRDITAQQPRADQQPETSRTEHKRQVEAVFEAPGSFIGILDPDGTLLRANQMAWEFADASPAEYVGTPFWEGPWFDHDVSLQERIHEAIEQADDGTVTEFEGVHYDPAGDPHNVSILISPVTGDDGQVETIVAQGIDVTERVQREKHLTAEREQMETILDNAPIILFTLDPDGVFTASRGNGLEKLGLEAGEAVGNSVFEMYADSPAVLDDCKRALDGEHVESNTQIGDLHFHTIYHPVFDENGDLEQIIGVSRDVTELQQRERELESWQARLQTVLDNAPLALYSYDPDGTVTMSQGRGLETVGLEPGQLEGENIFEVYPDQTALLEDYERALDGESFATVRELGTTIFRTWYRPIVTDGTVEQVICVSIDITEQKRQEQRIEAVNEATSDLITAESPEEVIDIVMQLADDLLNMPLSVIWTASDESESLIPTAATQSVLDRRDATTATDALSPIEPGTAEMATFEEGETRVIEDYQELDRQAHPDTDLGTLVILPLGRFGQLHVGTSDASSPSKAELNIMEILARNAEAALERAERQTELDEYRAELEESNERLQQFAYIASHDLQEPLRMVSSYVDLLAMEYGDELDDEADEYIEFAVDGASRMQSMIEDLLQYSRVQSNAGEFTAVDAEQVVEETCKSLELAIEDEDATVTAESLPTVVADRDQLGQVFQNLISNAVKHGGESPTVSIRSTVDDEYTRFEVEDDGPGIPENQQERLFKIFQQGNRDSESSGTGIGLAVCERIVSRHGGDIWIESDAGEGSTFCFTIPNPVPEDDTMAVTEPEAIDDG